MVAVLKGLRSVRRTSWRTHGKRARKRFEIFLFLFLVLLFVLCFASPSLARGEKQTCRGPVSQTNPRLPRRPFLAPLCCSQPHRGGPPPCACPLPSFRASRINQKVWPEPLPLPCLSTSPLASRRVRRGEGEEKRGEKGEAARRVGSLRGWGADLKDSREVRMIIGPRDFLQSGRLTRENLHRAHGNW